jgi:uncharacterized protein (DUF433 family)
MGFAALYPSYALACVGSKPYRENAMAHIRVATSPNIMDGKPVIRGTRIPVELILRKLGIGMSPEAILADHPRLTPDDIRAAQKLYQA